MTDDLFDKLHDIVYGKVLDISTKEVIDVDQA